MGYFVYNFEKLSVWQNARDLVKRIYIITKGFPDSEKYLLTNQMRRSAISVSSNIAEGINRTSKKEQGRFTTIAYSSLIELLNQVILALDMNYVTNVEYHSLRTKIEKISNQLNALKKYQLGI